MSVAPKKAKLATGNEYRCLRCGRDATEYSRHFYMSKWSEQFTLNDNVVPLCKTCINELFKTYTRRYRSEKMACILLCYMLDVPFYHALYDSAIEKNANFTMGYYLRLINGRQYNNKTFAQTILEGELDKSDEQVEDEKEDRWPSYVRQNMQDTLEIVGYDPFEGFSAQDRRNLFNEIVKYFDGDIHEDTFKLSQIIQIVINNNQVRKIDLTVSGLEQSRDTEIIKNLTDLKSKLVTATNNIAKENEISVKNRSDKSAGRSTLTYLMRDMREKDIEGAEANFYDVLKSPGTQWAIDMSMQSMKVNAMFDENDVVEIIEYQRQMIVTLQAEVDELTEEKRLLSIENNTLRAEIREEGVE